MFSSKVDDLVFSWTEHQQETFQTLRSIILESNSAIVESVKYNVPFYTLNGLLMYISPTKDENLYLGFCQGDLMLDTEGMFAADVTKNVRKIYFIGQDQVEWQIIQSYILEAVDINLQQRSFTKRKKPH